MICSLSRTRFNQTSTHETLSAELQECRSKLDAISRGMAVIEFRLDGEIVDANQNFLNTLGYSLEEIVGQHHRIFIDSEERNSQEYSQFWHRLNNGQHFNGEFKRIRKNGEPIWIQAMYFPVVDVNGHPTKVVKFAHDITEQFRLRESSRNVGVAVSDSIEQMTLTISEISQVVRKTVDLTNTTEVEVKSTQDHVNELSASSKAIEAVVALIRGLADQTNLLALNATIESARAGEAGKGFAVVAHEVKELAKETAIATEKITNSVSDIQRVVSECLNSAARVSDSVGGVSEGMSCIAAAVEEQSATMHGLNQTASELAG